MWGNNNSSRVFLFTHPFFVATMHVAFNYLGEIINTLVNQQFFLCVYFGDVGEDMSIFGDFGCSRGNHLGIVVMQVVVHLKFIRRFTFWRFCVFQLFRVGLFGHHDGLFDDFGCSHGNHLGIKPWLISVDSRVKIH